MLSQTGGSCLRGLRGLGGTLRRCANQQIEVLKIDNLGFAAKTPSTAKLAEAQLSFAKHSALLENTPAFISTSKRERKHYGIE